MGILDCWNKHSFSSNSSIDANISKTNDPRTYYRSYQTLKSKTKIKRKIFYKDINSKRVMILLILHKLVNNLLHINS